MIFMKYSPVGLTMAKFSEVKYICQVVCGKFCEKAPLTGKCHYGKLHTTINAMKENRFRFEATESRRLVRAGAWSGKRLVPEQDLPKRQPVVDHGRPRYRPWICWDPRARRGGKQGGTAVNYRPLFSEQGTFFTL